MSDPLLPTASAPNGIKVAITSNLTGIVVTFGEGPSANDPLGQIMGQYVYANVSEALNDLTRVATEFLGSRIAKNSDLRWKG